MSALRGLRGLALGLAAGGLTVSLGLAPLRVDGVSMAPAYPDGAVVLVVRPALDALLRPGARYRPGDAVVVAVPGGGLALKRVAAMGPATVRMERGALYVDGEAVPAPRPGQEGVTDLPPIQVPEGSVFVLGDDRRPLASRDSRDYGPLPVGAVRGRVVAAWRP